MGVARLALATSLILCGCSSGGGGADPSPGPSSSPNPTTSPTPTPSATPVDFSQLVTLSPTATAINLMQPLDLQFDAAGLAYVVEQGGTIKRFDPAGDGAAASVFLDISDRVTNSGEMGLLGLALHPDFASNGRLFVNYTQAVSGEDIAGRSMISEFTATTGQADAGSETVLLTVDQPFSNHNAGALAFGPTDNLLYLGLGDGGSGGDPQNNGQTPQTLLGSILRLDVDNPDPGRAYGIPQSNPFFGNSQNIREEIFAFGLRNPFKISFDQDLGSGQVLWAADVGQNSIEEVDIIVAGANYGWNTMEGSACFAPSSGCDMSGLTLPEVEYTHDLGRSITGGYVYRGSRLPELAGHYVFGDFVSGRLFAFDPAGDAGLIELADTDLNISSFGQDASGELFVVDYGGQLFRLERQ